MGKYAAETTVSVEKSRSEIETILTRYGADQFMYATGPAGAVIAFRAHGRMIKFEMALPDRESFRMVKHRNRAYAQRRTDEQTIKAWEQGCRQRWRALALVIKAKLEAVESGITEFETEFLAHIMLPNGTTVGQNTRPLIARAYESNEMPKLLPEFVG